MLSITTRLWAAVVLGLMGSPIPMKRLAREVALGWAPENTPGREQIQHLVAGSRSG